MVQTQILEAPGRVNGVDVDAVTALIADIRAERAKGRTRWHVASTWQGQTHSRHEVKSFWIGGEEVERRFAIDIDEPHELAGGNTFANPQEYLLAALNACMVVGYVALATLHGITLENLEIETEGEIDLAGFLGIDPDANPGYDSLRYTVRIKAEAPDERLAEIHRMVMATSPNFANLSRAVTLKPELIIQ